MINIAIDYHGLVMRNFLPMIGFLLLTQLWFSNPKVVQAAIAVQVPQVYLREQAGISLTPDFKAGTCNGPVPYKGAMVFRSRYEGSNKARDKVNYEAEQSYLRETAPMDALQKYLAKSTDEIVKGKGGKGTMDCILGTLTMWAQQSDLFETTENHTGKAVRKWTLAAISSNLLKIQLLAEEYDQETLAEIKSWVAKLSEQVVADYSGRSLDRMNNHDYWAAWSVITSAALLNRKDLFDWAESVFVKAMMQVNKQGFLPNELRRKSRGAMYHNFALTPLVGIAVFLKANGVDPFQFNNKALARLSTVVIGSVQNVSSFEKETGVVQVVHDLKVKGRLSWLAMYVYLDQSAATRYLSNIALEGEGTLSFVSSRMGGDLDYLYLGAE